MSYIITSKFLQLSFFSYSFKFFQDFGKRKLLLASLTIVAPVETRRWSCFFCSVQYFTIGGQNSGHRVTFYSYPRVCLEHEIGSKKRQIFPLFPKMFSLLGSCRRFEFPGDFFYFFKFLKVYLFHDGDCKTRNLVFKEISTATNADM